MTNSTKGYGYGYEASIVNGFRLRKNTKDVTDRRNGHRYRNLITHFFLQVSLVIFATMAVAVPQYVNYQGVLRDSSGNLVTGTKSMVFKLYSASTGGTALWTMTSSEVVVSNGLYNVKLGPITSADLGSGSRWLEITIASDVLTPRLEVLSVAYAIAAGTAESAANATTVGGYAVATSGNSIIPVTDSSGKLSSSVIPSSGATTDYATLSGTATTAGTVANTAAAGASAITAINSATSGTIAAARIAAGVASADYATLSGTATTAASVDNTAAAGNSVVTALNSASTGTIASGRLSGSYGIDITGNAATATSATSATNALGVTGRVSAEAGTGYSLWVNGAIGVNSGSNQATGNNTVPTGIGGIEISNNLVTTSSIILLMAGPYDTGATDEPIKVATIGTGTFTVKALDGNADAPITFKYLIIN